MTPFSNTVSARLLRRLAKVICQHPRWFVYPQIALALAGGLYTAAWLKLDMNRGHLVGTNSRQQRLYLEYRQEFPREEELVVVVQGGRRERNRQFIERLAARVAPETNLFTGLIYKGDLATPGAQSAAAGAGAGPGRDAPGLARVSALHPGVNPGDQSQLPVPPGEQTVPHRAGGGDGRDGILGAAHPVAATPHRAGQSKPAAPGHPALAGRRNALCRGRTSRTIDLPRLERRDGSIC